MDAHQPIPLSYRPASITFFAHLVVAMMLLLHGCVVHQPVPAYAPPPGPSTYDRAWDSAVKAAQDSGIKLTTVDRSSGLISGSREGITARIKVVKQADGSTKVQMDLDGDLQRDPKLNDRFLAAYNRYMGR
jgi:hypothetical protein